jgi:hypothetical protein
MNILRELAIEQQQRLMAALTMTAGREKGAGVGGHVHTLAMQISNLNAWVRAYDHQQGTFNAWAKITHEAGFYWDEWYEWYTREYSTPLEPLFNFSIDEWCKLGGLSGIASILQGVLVTPPAVENQVQERAG